MPRSQGPRGEPRDRKAGGGAETGNRPDTGKKVTRLLKDSKLKVQAQLQGEKVRVTGKKRDDLQEAIALLRKTSFDVPLQFNNFRD